MSLEKAPSNNLGLTFQENVFKMSRYNEKRVRVAFDEIVFQWATDGCIGEEYDAFLEVLHDEDTYEIYGVIENNLEEALLDLMSEIDLEELIRRLRNQYPQKEDDDETVDEEDEEEDDVEEETPEQFEARRARMYEWYKPLGLTPRHIRRLVRDTRR